MAKRQRDWARKRRLLLRRLLGMKCAECGSRDYRKLEFDVIVPVKHINHHRIEWSWRMSFYYQQYKQNNLQLLCGNHIKSCHNKKTYKENYSHTS